MDRRQWQVTAITSSIIFVATFIWLLMGVYDYEIDITSDEITDCKAGMTTPEELGYPDLTCNEIEQKYNEGMYATLPAFCLSLCLSLPLALTAFLKLAFTKDSAGSVDLAVFSQEATRLQNELQQTQDHLRQAHIEAEQKSIQAQTAHSQMVSQSEEAHRTRMIELEGAEQRAREEMDAARRALEHAEKARMESVAAAETARMERLAALGAKQELIHAAQKITPQPTQPQAPQFNVHIVNKEYTDSVHQEDK